MLPTRRDGRIRVPICHSDTSEHYTCLSYAWGESDEGFDVNVEGHPMRVRRTLFRFLDVASRRCSDQNLWIDALCISQNDNSAKNHQVQRMGRIYRGADQVIVWLGVKTELNTLFNMVREGTLGMLPVTQGVAGITYEKILEGSLQRLF